MTSVEAPITQRVEWRLVMIFVVVAFGLAWLVCLPLWLTDGLRNPLFTVYAVGMMYTPALTALLLWLVQRRRGRAPSLGMRWVRPYRRVFLLALLSAIFFPLLSLAALLLSWAFGTIHLDPVHLSGFAEYLQTQLTAAGRPTPPFPLWLLAVLQVVNVLVGTLVNCVFTVGEELGWRGWLLPMLRPLGVWPALILTGVIWGAWHAPLILLGYNYDRRDALGVLLMIVFCTLLGIPIGWLRLRSGTIWPSVVAHAGINASTGTWLVVLLRAGDHPSPISSTLLGWPGWLLMAAVIAVGTLLIRRTRLRPGRTPSLPEMAAPR